MTTYSVDMVVWASTIANVVVDAPDEETAKDVAIREVQQLSPRDIFQDFEIQDVVATAVPTVEKVD